MICIETQKLYLDQVHVVPFLHVDFLQQRTEIELRHLMYVYLHQFSSLDAQMSAWHTNQIKESLFRSQMHLEILLATHLLLSHSLLSKPTTLK